MRRLPAELERTVTDVGLELRRQVVGDDLFLLALARLDPVSAVRQVLDDHGLAADVLLDNIRVAGDGPAGPRAGFTYSPAYYLMHGRAEAFAAALGDGTIEPEHVLLSLLWDPGSRSAYLLDQLGVRSEALVEGLARRGIPVPAAPAPERPKVDFGPRVWFDRDQVQRVIDHLRSTLGPGVRWGFNYEGDRAWAVAESSVDLDALVAEALPPAIEVRRLDHVQLAMPAGREDEAAAFYEGLLGLPRVPKPERLAGRGGCWFEQGDVRVHLGVDPDFRPARKAHPALLVRGLAALTQRLREAGVPVTEDGDAGVYVADPFGNRVELLERSGTMLGPP